MGRHGEGLEPRARRRRAGVTYCFWYFTRARGAGGIGVWFRDNARSSVRDDLPTVIVDIALITSIGSVQMSHSLLVICTDVRRSSRHHHLHDRHPRAGLPLPNSPHSQP